MKLTVFMMIILIMMWESCLCVCVQNCLGLIPIPGNVRVFTVGFHLTHAIHGTGCISQRQKGRGQEEIASAREEREREGRRGRETEVESRQREGEI